MNDLNDELEPKRDEAARVVSLLPSATEIVCALGAGASLVGISHECDFPSAISGLPVLTRSRIDAHGSSRAIDAAVREVLRDALSLYAVDEPLLAALEPDLIVTQDLCEVCAVSLDDVKAAVARLSRRENVRIVSLKPTRLGDVVEDCERVAEALGRPAAGKRLRGELEARVAQIAERAERAARASRRPRVATLEWLEPLMLGGTWMPELIELSGGVALGARAGEPAPTVSLAELALLRPDVVLVKPCGFSLARALDERAVLERCLRATAGDGVRVYVSDGAAFFNRPGPRLVESLEILAACVHPSAFEDFETKHRAVVARLA
jgi:iron complex transport system substrate-binding protein